MSLTFDRTDTSIFGRWWWTVDRLLLAALVLLMAVGVVLIMAASPAVADRIGLDNYHFVQRHIVMLAPSLLITVAVSLLPSRKVRYLAFGVFLITIAMLVLVPFVGVEIKGARRWLHLPGMSIQPSEFLKPSFAIVTAWLFAQWRTSETYFPGNLIAMALYGLCAGLLLLQPDLGQTFVLTAVWFSQFFLAGLNIMLVAGLAVAGMAGLVGAYFVFPHVTSRIDRFLDPNAGDNYQVTRSLEAFANGGFLGTGPGQGTVKMYLPDAHADFVFSVAGEEFGLVVCVLIVALYGFIVLRGFKRVSEESSLFAVLAVSGLLIQFGLQSLINMGSSLHLMPTKGMTLPFLSYGGSSLLALGYGMGMVLALTRKRFGNAET
ncbi:MAG TPA: putative lipid II flippase FtsW [Azospirillaceae bacterium]|nr:putative lipid II flippase FtsW [Azospirillaceae bacterium]